MWRVYALGGMTACTVWTVSEINYSVSLAVIGLAAIVMTFVLSVEYVLRIACVLWQMQNVAHGPRSAFRCCTTTWTVAGLLICATWSALGTNWPLAARFALSQSALQEAANEVLRTGALPSGPRWIGLYVVDMIDMPGPGVVRFQVSRSTWGERAGFVYRAPPTVSETTAVTIAGRWTTESWY
jgi:hypothetical protein